jgi:diguanylate cyclase (GGDEF)-like protein
MNAYDVQIAAHPTTVLLSVVLAMLATYAGMGLSGRIRHAPDRQTGLAWMLVGSIAMGSGIFALHIVGMAAASYPFAARYAGGPLAWCWLEAVFTAAAFLAAVTTPSSRRSLIALWSCIAGVSAVGMHFAGVIALDISPHAGYDIGGLAIAGALVALATGCVASWVARHRKAHAGAHVAIAVIHGACLAAMHYVAMFSTRFADTAKALNEARIDVYGQADTVAYYGLGFLALIAVIVHLEARTAQRARLFRGSLERTERELHFRTFNDAVTGLPNRILFQDRLKQAGARGARSGDGLAVLSILTDASVVLPTASEFVRDEAQRCIARCLTETARDTDTVAVAGTDHFLLLIEAANPTESASDVAMRTLVALADAGCATSSRAKVNASIGISVYPHDGDLASLAHNAHAAAIAVESDGGNAFRFFTSTMHAEAQARAEWLADLRMAVERNELQLYYQPKVKARGSRLAGVEALLRWNHPTRGLVGPCEFIPLAERYGLIDDFGRWVVEEAARQMRAWIDDGLEIPVAVNISTRQLRRPGLAEEIVASLRRHRVPTHLLTCEVTESGAMDDHAQSLAIFHQLRDAGIGISIDDFGTGYSSLSYLRRLPASEIKIDRSFVNDLSKSVEARAIIAAIVDLAHSLRLDVVAEGVETAEERRILVELNCDRLQGFLFAKPQPASSLDAFLRVAVARVPLGPTLIGA